MSNNSEILENFKHSQNLSFLVVITVQSRYSYHLCIIVSVLLIQSPWVLQRITIFFIHSNNRVFNLNPLYQTNLDTRKNSYTNSITKSIMQAIGCGIHQILLKYSSNISFSFRFLPFPSKANLFHFLHLSNVHMKGFKVVISDKPRMNRLNFRKSWDSALSTKSVIRWHSSFRFETSNQVAGERELSGSFASRQGSFTLLP